LLRVAFDQRLDKCGFANAGRAHDADDDRGRFFGEAVDERDVKALFFDLGYLAELPRQKKVAYFVGARRVSL
jgi:hypothetical protein